LLPLVQAQFEESLSEGKLLELDRADGEAEAWLAVLAEEVGLDA